MRNEIWRERKPWAWVKLTNFNNAAALVQWLQKLRQKFSERLQQRLVSAIPQANPDQSAFFIRTAGEV
jgi:hypothetical protein